MRTSYLRSLLAFVFISFIALGAKAQGTYSSSLPTMQGYGLTSWTAFTFTATPATTGEAVLSFQWLGCYQSGFSGTGIAMELRTGASTYVPVHTETGVLVSCSFQTRTVTISASTLAAAMAYAGGNSVQGRVRITDACAAGVGCSFYNDPVLQNFTMNYTVVSANFTSPDATICPGGVVQFTDASLNVPSAYAWSFPGGTPDTSNLANPVVQYSAPGTYPVTLEVTTADGPSTITRPAFVTVYNLPNAFAGIDQTVCAGANAQLQASGGTSYQWIPTTGLSNATISNPVATISNSTAYTVIVTSAQGCEASDAVLLTVTPLPQIAIQSAGTALCGNDTLDVTVSGASLYTWSPNLFISSNTGASVQVWPPATFSWTVTGTDLNGCIGSNTLDVTVSPAPTTPLITWADMVLSSSAAEGYQWYMDGTPIPDATEQEHTPLENGTYTVVTTDANGCSASSAPYFFGSTGINGNDATQITLVPQPASDRLQVRGADAGTHYRLIDAQGRLVAEGSINGNTHDIAVQHLAVGMHTLLLTHKDHTTRLPVLIGR
ncbi:MAG: PKD domain-containing protein [Flavobacteriales bacterium]|nr:PKD domain-containing protein [Flavobacteriales bacterium]